MKTNRQLTIIQCVPDDRVWFSQTLVQLANFREMGVSHFYRVLVFTPPDRTHNGINPDWKLIEEQFPEAKIFYYTDQDNLFSIIEKIEYIPLIRPYMLYKHFKENPELSENAVLYLDSDVIFSKKPDFNPYLDDEICYLSDTKGYLNSDWFDSKIHQVLPEKLAAYKQVDVLETVAKLSNITREICEKNKNATGGAQYLLKNITPEFWKKVLNRCIAIRTTLFYKTMGVNFHFFENEDQGFQSWCADMWAVLHTLWEEGKETQTPEYFNFNWGTDLIEKWNQNLMYHDAGGAVGHKDGIAYPLFNKRDMRFIRKPEDNPITYFEADLSHVSPHHCSKKYVEWINFTKEKYRWK